MAGSIAELAAAAAERAAESGRAAKSGHAVQDNASASAE
jgi:hypothetical protein